LYGAAIYLFLLHFGWSAAMRNFAERTTRFKPLQTFIYWTEFLVVTTILGAPLALYEGYFRERQYGLATQTLLPWLGDRLIILLVNVVLGGVVSMVLLGVVRRLPRTWWIWGAGVSVIFLIFFIMIAPVFIFPLLNKYTVLEDPKITQPS
jgi:STE24 endopeptidase